MDSNATELFLEEWRNNVLPLTVFVGIVSVFGIAGNACLLYVHFFRYRKCTFRSLVIGLCMVDIVGCFVIVPIEIFTQTNYFSSDCEAICKIATFLNTFTAICIVSFLFSICLDRYLKLIRPHNRQLQSKEVLLIFVITLISAIAESLPITFSWGTSHKTGEYNGQSVTTVVCGRIPHMKTGPIRYISIGLLLPNYILIVVILVMYGFIFRTLSRFARRRNSVSGREPSCKQSIGSSEGLTQKEINMILKNSIYEDIKKLSEPKTNEEERHTVDKTRISNVKRISLATCIFTVVFLFTAISYMAFSLYLEAFRSDTVTSTDFGSLVLMIFLQRLYFFNYLVHPVIFGILDPNFRRSLPFLKNFRSKVEENVS